MKLQINKKGLFKIRNFIFSHKFIIAILSFYLISYLILGIFKHQNFLSGYDLSIMDQAVWKYSRFINPISTTHVYFDTPIYKDHFELILILISPIYWIFDSVLTLIVLQVISIIFSAIGIYKIASLYKLKKFIKHIILICYLNFYGIQFSLWSDVHSLVFAIGFLSWFYYFLIKEKRGLMILFLFLAMICKEDIALLTLLLACIHFIKSKSKNALIAVLISIFYLLLLFMVYFPFIVGGYKYANPNGILHDPNPFYMINTEEKQKAIIYSLGSYGFLPILAPLYLIPFFGDLAHYFILGNKIVTSAHGIFAHYRSSISLLLVIPTIIAISKFKKNNNILPGLYLLFFGLFFQYYLHLPLSYLSKKWFWNGTPERKNIESMIKEIPINISIVTQNNLTPHLSHRKDIYTLFPTIKDFKNDSPCGIKSCKWFRVGGNPKFLLIDTGPSWNILHYLSQREEFLQSIDNLKKNKNINLIKKIGSTELYEITKKI